MVYRLAGIVGLWDMVAVGCVRALVCNTLCWIKEGGEENCAREPVTSTKCRNSANIQDPSGPVTLRTSKFITNRLLNRKQFVVTLTHPTRANLSRDEVAEKLATLYKADKTQVVVFGMRTKFGGGVTQGFGLVYDDEESQKKFEPRYRLVRVSSGNPLAWLGPQALAPMDFADLRTASLPRLRSHLASSARSARTGTRRPAAPRRLVLPTRRSNRTIYRYLVRRIGFFCGVLVEMHPYTFEMGREMRVEKAGLGRQHRSKTNCCR